MSNPSLVQITFQITKDMPVDMKKMILYGCTDYYQKYYNDKKPKWNEYLALSEKYPEIAEMMHNDWNGSHNVEFQRRKLKQEELYDIDTLHRWERSGDEPFGYTIGVSILSMPLQPDVIDRFFKLVGSHISSEVSTLGICHCFYFGDECNYYYRDYLGRIRKHVIRIDNTNDEIL